MIVKYGGHPYKWERIYSDVILRENTDDGHLDIFVVAKMCLVSWTKEPETDKGQQDKEHMADLAALLPRRDLRWIGLGVVVVDTTVQPVTIGIHMVLFKVTEFVQRMMLEVVGFDLVILGRLGLILISIMGNYARRIILVEVLRVIAGVVMIHINITFTFGISRKSGLLACKQTLPPTHH